MFELSGPPYSIHVKEESIIYVLHSEWWETDSLTVTLTLHLSSWMEIYAKSEQRHLRYCTHDNRADGQRDRWTDRQPNNVNTSGRRSGSQHKGIKLLVFLFVLSLFTGLEVINKSKAKWTLYAWTTTTEQRPWLQSLQTSAQQLKLNSFCNLHSNHIINKI